MLIKIDDKTFVNPDQIAYVEVSEVKGTVEIWTNAGCAPRNYQFQLNDQYGTAFMFWLESAENCIDLMAVHKAKGQGKAFVGIINKAQGLFAEKRCHDCHNWVKDCICNM